MTTEACPTCGSTENGCTVRDVGAFCRAPGGGWSYDMRAAVRRFQSQTPRAPLVVGRDIGARTAAAISAARREGVAGVIVFAIPPAAPVVACRRCSIAVVWIELPTGGRMAVTHSTREAHDATCLALPRPR